MPARRRRHLGARAAGRAADGLGGDPRETGAGRRTGRRATGGQGRRLRRGHRNARRLVESGRRGAASRLRTPHRGRHRTRDPARRRPSCDDRPERRTRGGCPTSRRDGRERRDRDRGGAPAVHTGRRLASSGRRWRGLRAAVHLRGTAAANGGPAVALRVGDDLLDISTRGFEHGAGEGGHDPESESKSESESRA